MPIKYDRGFADDVAVNAATIGHHFEGDFRPEIVEAIATAALHLTEKETLADQEDFWEKTPEDYDTTCMQIADELERLPFHDFKAVKDMVDSKLVP